MLEFEYYLRGWLAYGVATVVKGPHITTGIHQVTHRMEKKIRKLYSLPLASLFMVLKWWNRLTIIADHMLSYDSLIPSRSVASDNWLTIYIEWSARVHAILLN